MVIECNRIRTRRCRYAGEKRRTVHRVLSSVGASGGLEHPQTPTSARDKSGAGKSVISSTREGGKNAYTSEAGGQGERARRRAHVVGHTDGQGGRAELHGRGGTGWVRNCARKGEAGCMRRLETQVDERGERVHNARDGLSES